MANDSAPSAHFQGVGNRCVITAHYSPVWAAAPESPPGLRASVELRGPVRPALRLSLPALYYRRIVIEGVLLSRADANLCVGDISC